MNKWNKRSKENQFGRRESFSDSSDDESSSEDAYWEYADEDENDPNYEYAYVDEVNIVPRFVSSKQDKQKGTSANSVKKTSSTTSVKKYRYPRSLSNTEQKRENSTAEVIQYKKGLFGWIKKKWDEMSDLSAEDQSDIVEGRWDHWKAYYCLEETGKNTEVNEMFFSWAMLYTLGMTSFLDLIFLIQKNGGFAFLIVCFCVYIGVGYPLYCIETMIGQYSGRKPLAMIRFMSPHLQGLGPALYFRTFFIGVESLVTFLYGAHYFLDLYVCQVNHNELLGSFTESENESTPFLWENVKMGGTRGFLWENGMYEWMLIIFIVTVAFSFGGIRTFGRLYSLVMKGAFCAWAGYLIISVMNSFGGDKNSIMYVPLFKTFSTDWMKLVSGKVWIDAVFYTISSLGLVTLVHPYLASRCFFHYRTARDGIFIIILTMLYNLIGAVAVLLVLGYVTVNSKEMLRALEQIGGFQGLFITYVMKNNQGNLMAIAEYDIEFYCAVFYGLTGTMSLIAFHGSMKSLIQSSFQEYTAIVMAVFIISFTIALFTFVIPAVFVSYSGLQILIYIEFYLHHTFSVIFIVGCFFWSVAYCHNFAKIVYDFRNIFHLNIFEPLGMGENLKLCSHYPKIARNLIMLCIILVLIHSVVRTPYPRAAGIDYSAGQSIAIGFLFAGLPIIFIVFTGIVACISKSKKKGNKSGCKSHRDFYKNWYHTVICFPENKTIGRKRGQQRSSAELK